MGRKRCYEYNDLEGNVGKKKKTEEEPKIESRNETESKDPPWARINSPLEKQSFGQADLPEDNRPFLPPEIIDRIIKETMRSDGSMLNVFNRVSSSFRALTDKHLPWLHFRYDLAEDLQLNEEDDINISVQAIIKEAGKGSGLFFKIKELFGKNNRWRTAWLTIHHEKFGRYTVKDIFWCDWSPSQKVPPVLPQKTRLKRQHQKQNGRERAAFEEQKVKVAIFS